MYRVVGNVGDPEELRMALTGVCRTFGDVARVTHFCRRRSGEEIVCSIRMQGDLEWAARVLGGVVSATGEVCLVGRMPHDFRCPGRSGGLLSRSNCHACDGPAALPVHFHAAGMAKLATAERRIRFNLQAE
jgi:hypothetical protein